MDGGSFSSPMKRSHSQVPEEASPDFSVEEDINFNELPGLSKYISSSPSQSSFSLPSKENRQEKRRTNKKKPKNINELIQSLSEEEIGKNDQREPNEWSKKPSNRNDRTSDEDENNLHGSLRSSLISLNPDDAMIDAKTSLSTSPTSASQGSSHDHLSESLTSEFNDYSVTHERRHPTPEFNDYKEESATTTRESRLPLHSTVSSSLPRRQTKDNKFLRDIGSTESSPDDTDKKVALDSIFKDKSLRSKKDSSWTPRSLLKSLPWVSRNEEKVIHH